MQVVWLIRGCRYFREHSLWVVLLRHSPLGRHCCLLCRIEQTQLKETPSCRTQQPALRDLVTLATAHSDFTSKGNSNLAVAKKYFNVIARPFFNIPLDQVVNKMFGIKGHLYTHVQLQVCIPGLHISLGIFYRLFSLLEDAVHCLDFEVAPTSSAAQQSSRAVEEYVKALQQLEKLKEEQVRVDQQATVMEQVTTLTSVSSMTISPTLVEAMLEEAATLRHKLEGIVSIFHIFKIRQFYIYTILGKFYCRP